MKVKDTVNYEELKQYLNAPIENFYAFGEVIKTVDGVYIHKDNGSNTLAVAHLDSVNTHNHFHVNRIDDKDYIFSTHVDDRLGAYIILRILPLLGIHSDILLTEGEEKGRSTARHFKTDKKYNWMYSFDRRGTDAVYYRYNVKEWLDILKKSFDSPAHGSVSDIDYLGHLGCCGVNVGTGYHEEHHLLAHAIVSETKKQIGRFLQFYNQYKNQAFVFVDRPVYVARVPYSPPPPPVAAPRDPFVAGTEEPEIEEEVIYDPYFQLESQLPLDVLDYTTEEGVIRAPMNCAFCLEPLRVNGTAVFMGICKKCQKWAIQCEFCGEYVCRTDNATPDMSHDDLFLGVCVVCNDNMKEYYNSTPYEEDDDYNFRNPPRTNRYEY